MLKREYKGGKMICKLSIHVSHHTRVCVYEKSDNVTCFVYLFWSIFFLLCENIRFEKNCRRKFDIIRINIILLKSTRAYTSANIHTRILDKEKNNKVLNKESVFFLLKRF